MGRAALGRAVCPPRFVARWVSPQGSVRVFLGLGADPDDARRRARRALRRRDLAFASTQAIEVTSTGPGVAPAGDPPAAPRRGAGARG